LTSNYGTIQIIQREVFDSSLWEAFLESAPQLILQTSIIIRTGIASECFNKFNFSIKTPVTLIIHNPHFCHTSH